MKRILLVAFFTLLLVAPPASAATKPVVGAVTPTTGITAKAEETFSVTLSPSGTVGRCYFYDTFDRVGEMEVGATKATIDYTFSASGEHDVYVVCYGKTGGLGVSPVVSIDVDPAPGEEDPDAGNDNEDKTDPTIGTVLPDFATAGIPVELRVSAFDASGIASCTLYVVGGTSMPMTYNATRKEATVMYTFNVAGESLAYAICRDTAGNFISSQFTTIRVTEGYPSSEGAEPGTLIKMQCGADYYVNHPCTTVYYYGFDGKRHPFPNEKMYFSWYPNYDSLHIVSSRFMAALPIGERVTYKPGARMVKFLTNSTVYFVDAKATLRSVASEQVAYAYYGAAWNSVIDDISDAFFTDYQFGSTVDSTDDFSPAVASSQAGIEDNW